MSTPVPENKPEYIRRMADDGSGNLASQAQVDSNVDASFAELAQVVTDTGDLPVTTSIRPNGSFSDAESLHQYLETGGLIVTDVAGDAEPIGFVWLLKEWDPILLQYMWTVYIDSQTN